MHKPNTIIVQCAQAQYHHAPQTCDRLRLYSQYHSNPPHPTHLTNPCFYRNNHWGEWYKQLFLLALLSFVNIQGIDSPESQPGKTVWQNVSGSDGSHLAGMSIQPPNIFPHKKVLLRADGTSQKYSTAIRFYTSIPSAIFPNKKFSTIYINSTQKMFSTFCHIST